MGKLRYANQVVIVTGAGRGMGKSHALLLAERGASVVVNDIGCDVSGKGADQSFAQSVVNEITSAGGIALASTDDIATREGCKSLVVRTIERFGRLDAIVHNAGICYQTLLPNITTADLDANFNVHFRAGFYLTQEAWPQFIKQGGGRLLYIVPAAGLFGNNTYAHYGSAKMALVGLMRTVHLEGAEHGIRCNALAVAASTRMAAGVFTPELKKWFSKYITTQAVSPAVAWLIHPDCPSSGEIYQAMGNRVMRIVVAESQGYQKLGNLTPEEVRDNFDKISALDKWWIPKTTMEDIIKGCQEIVEAGGDPLPLPGN